MNHEVYISVNGQDFLKLLEEQSSVYFTGKINIIDSNTGQFLGEVILRDGEVIYSKYGNQNGLKSLVQLGIDNHTKSSKNKFIVEPEVVSSYQRDIDHNYLEIINLIKLGITENHKLEKLKPPGNLKLTPTRVVFSGADLLDNSDFEVLLAMVNYPLVEDIYKNTNMITYEVTKSLVRLKKNSLVRVLK